MNEQQLIEANLIGYLLDSLDEATRARVEADLKTDPEMRQCLEQMRLALEPLACDKDEPAPPDDLVPRTIARIAEFSCRELPRAPVSLSRAVSERTWWRRADVLVAASLLLVFMGLAFSMVWKWRGPGGAAAMAECQNNLRVFHAALQSYHDQHGRFPNVAAEHPRSAAGMVVPILASAGLLADRRSLRCPGVGEPNTSITLDECRTMTPDEFFRKASALVPSYTYSLGYRDDRGNYHGPVVPPDQTAHHLALMSDAPPPAGSPGNSPNHGATGQNVLFADGTVRYTKVRTVGYQNDDIFVNRDKKVAAGADCFDTVLGPSAAKP